MNALIAQATDVLSSLNGLQGSDEMANVESIYADSNYRSDYWHSIEKIEFDDEYGPDLADNFTVDDLRMIAEEGGKQKTGSLAQFHGHPNPQPAEVKVSNIFLNSTKLLCLDLGPGCIFDQFAESQHSVCTTGNKQKKSHSQKRKQGAPVQKYT